MPAGAAMALPAHVAPMLARIGSPFDSPMSKIAGTPLCRIAASARYSRRKRWTMFGETRCIRFSATSR